jgi:hypothetical protein
LPSRLFAGRMGWLPYDAPGARPEEVLGTLAPAVRTRVFDVLGEVDDGLRSLVETLSIRSGRRWQTEGVTVDTYPDPPVKHALSAYADHDGLTFGLELTRGCFFEGLGRDLDLWYVDADVYVLPDRPHNGGQETVATQTFGPFDDALAAVAGLRTALAWLCEQAGSRDPSASAWGSASF